jgi:hypothetical protein
MQALEEEEKEVVRQQEYQAIRRSSMFLSS